MSDLKALPDIPLGAYKHYKGAVYELIAVGYHSETLEPMCTYVSSDDNVVWSIEAAHWAELVSVPRFQIIADTIS